MKTDDWNDIKFALALYRTGKLKQAGKAVGVSDTTVARRIKVLERSLQTPLFRRSHTGLYEPTDKMLQILDQAENIEAGNAAIRAISNDSEHRITGSVRVSSVPIIVNRCLIPGVAALNRKNPHLTIELVPTSDNLDLSKREADLAVRFARPKEGGLRTKALKLSDMSFAAYGPSDVSPDQSEALGWIVYDDTHSDLPQARWLNAAARAAEIPAVLRVADVETALEAVAAGLGKTLLPCVVADKDPRLQAVNVNIDLEYPTREVWLLSHIDQAARLSVSAVKTWLTDLPWG